MKCYKAYEQDLMGYEGNIVYCKNYNKAIEIFNSAVKKAVADVGGDIIDKSDFGKEIASLKKWNKENDYALGFISGLEKMFEEQKKKNQEWGLVLVKDAEVVEAYNNIKFKGSINTSTSFQGHSEAYYQGKEDGEKFSISNKIAEGDTEEQLTLSASN